MKKYDIIAFDLDGTLTNPEKGLVAGFRYAFDKLGIKYESPESLKRFIGPPLFEEWRSSFRLSDAECTEALRVFREFYDVYGWRENEPYPKIAEMLAELRASGKRLVVATSKPERVANKVLNHFDLAKHFDFISTATLDKSRDKKCEVLEYALNSIGSPNKAKCVLVGDRKYDAEGAEIVGVDSLGVLYGHGSAAEIASAGFTYIAESVSDILKILT